MKRLVVAVVVIVSSACGGKAKSADEPDSTSCCCSTDSERELVADTVCEERGGTCDPAETCEATDPSENDGAGDSDRDDY